MKAAIVLGFGGAILMLIAYGLETMASPWDDLDADRHDERPSILQHRRWMRGLFWFGSATVAAAALVALIKLLHG